MLSMERMFVIGGLMLLSIITLIYGTSSSNQIEINFNNEAIITATALSQSLLEEIQTRAYDDHTVANHVESVDDLTTYSSLGPETGENSLTKYDDIDDFNGYQDTRKMERLNEFNFKVTVHYVSLDNPDVALADESFAKKIKISVDNPYLLNTISISKIVSY